MGELPTRGSRSSSGVRGPGFVPSSAESERSREGLADFVLSDPEDAEVPVAAELRVVAGSADHGKRAGLRAARGSRGRELRMEQDREGAAAIRARECLADGGRTVVDAAAAERAAAADELVDERARRAQRFRRGERAERRTFLR